MTNSPTNLENAERAEMGGWRPIETAPKDGTEYLLITKDGRQYVGGYRLGTFGEPQLHEVAWRCSSSGRFSNPTHWQPLPAAPGESRIRSCLIDKPEAGARGCEGRNYTCTCGCDDRRDVLIDKLVKALEVARGAINENEHFEDVADVLDAALSAAGGEE